MRRGQTLLEGMIAAMILAIGVTAIIQAILFSTIQNAGAGRYSEAAAIAGQVAAGLSRYDVRQLRETGAFLNSCAAPASPLTDYTAGIEAVAAVTDGDTRCAGGACSTTSLSATPCVVDVDAYDDPTGGTPANRRLVEGYDYSARYESGTGGYKRVAVVFDDSGTSDSKMVTVTVVVSFLEAGQRRFVRRNVSLTQSNGFAGF